MGLFQLDRGDLSPEASLKLYRAAFTWAASRGTTFELAIEPAVCDEPSDVAAFIALGTKVVPPTAERGDDVSEDLVRVRGVPDERFLHTLTSRTAPTRALAGDECPVEQVIISSDARAIYVCYDYGTVQIVDLDETERRDLEHALLGAGLPRVAFVPIERR